MKKTKKIIKRNWLSGLISILIIAFGISVPFWMNLIAEKTKANSMPKLAASSVSVQPNNNSPIIVGQETEKNIWEATKQVLDSQRLFFTGAMGIVSFVFAIIVILLRVGYREQINGAVKEMETKLKSEIENAKIEMDKKITESSTNMNKIRDDTLINFNNEIEKVKLTLNTYTTTVRNEALKKIEENRLDLLKEMETTKKDLRDNINFHAVNTLHMLGTTHKNMKNYEFAFLFYELSLNNFITFKLPSMYDFKIESILKSIKNIIKDGKVKDIDSKDNKEISDSLAKLKERSPSSELSTLVGEVEELVKSFRPKEDTKA
jgi:hypothetical protein